MNDSTPLSWETFLNPETLRTNLIVASIYIASFEVLKTAIVDRIKDFYTNGFDQNGLRIGPAYESRVLSKNRSPVYASLDWLKEADAIDDADISAFERAKKLRNELVHSLHGMFLRGLPADLSDRLGEMISLLDKIERWWVINVEIATDPEFIGREIDEQRIIPGTIMGLRLLLDIALGSEEESRKYYEEFTKQTCRKRK
jgi:hypothetical protein